MKVQFESSHWPRLLKTDNVSTSSKKDSDLRFNLQCITAPHGGNWVLFQLKINEHSVVSFSEMVMQSISHLGYFILPAKNDEHYVSTAKQ